MTTQMDTDNKIIVDENGTLHDLRSKPDWGLRISLALLFGLPAILLILKFLPWIGASTMADMFSLTRLPAVILRHVQRLMLMSLGAVIVVIFRLSLGIRVLGPVRPILIALAYQLTGFVVGTVFLVAVMIIIALIRPLLRSAGMPYFARIATVLSLVSLMVLVTLEIGMVIGTEEFLMVGLLPVVVLTFAAEGFAKTLYKEGIKSASWRTLMTILVAALINLLTDFPGMHHFVLRFPELLLIDIGLIYLVSRYCKFRAFEFLNPSPISVKKRKTNDKKSSKMQKRRVASNASSAVVLAHNSNSV